MAACSRCHREDLSGYTGLRGAKFQENWREDKLSSLWNRIVKTMPAGAPSSLSEADYLSVLAYILQANDFPSGTGDLNSRAVSEIKFQAKTGAEPVPEFALVETVGCLEADFDGTWRVKRASEPVRTRNPNESLAGELQVASVSPLGEKTFRLLDSSTLKLDGQQRKKVKVKGFLIRNQEEDRLNTTSVELLGVSCK